MIITRRYGLTTLVLSLALPSLTFFVSVFLFCVVCKTTVHTQVKQLRIKSSRDYIKPGVLLADGTRSTAPVKQLLTQVLPTIALELAKQGPRQILQAPVRSLQKAAGNSRRGVAIKNDSNYGARVKTSDWSGVQKGNRNLASSSSSSQGAVRKSSKRVQKPVAKTVEVPMESRRAPEKSLQASKSSLQMSSRTKIKPLPKALQSSQSAQVASTSFQNASVKSQVRPQVQHQTKPQVNRQIKPQKERTQPPLTTQQPTAIQQELPGKFIFYNFS